MTALAQTPTFSGEEAKRIASQHFGLTAESVRTLPSERDQNFLIREQGDVRWVLKISNGQELVGFVDGQNELLAHLTDRIDFCPAVRQSGGKKLFATVESSNGTTHIVRVVSFIEGRPLAELRYRSPKLLHSLGERIGQLSLALSNFEHDAFRRSFHWDLAEAVEVIAAGLDLVQDGELKQRIQRCVMEFETHCVPLLHQLPKSVVQNDANDGNVITSTGPSEDSTVQQVVGIIDFGDAVYTWTVSELAISIAYAILGNSNPLTAACDVVRGYVKHKPLAETEQSVLFGMIRLRLCVSIVMAAQQEQARPNDEYLSISQQPIRETLPQLCDVPHQVATEMFRDAAGASPSAKFEAVSKWLENNASRCEFPIDRTADSKLCIVDLSAGSTLLRADPNDWSTEYIAAAIERSGAVVGNSIAVGRYLEPRLLYAADHFVDSGFAPELRFDVERRTIHLGIDLFAAAGTTVKAIFDGVVERVDSCDAELDYGTLVILRHEPHDGETFYSLYGHMASCCRKLKPGQSIAAGEVIGVLGDCDDNGGWPPHLHLQLATDLLGISHNFPGVCRASQQSAWSVICPDPSVILNIEAANFRTSVDNAEQTANRRRHNLGRNVSVSYSLPLKIVRGWKHFLYDQSGHRFLDAFNNVPHVGHSHPRILEALTDQAAVLNTNTRYLHDLQNEFAEALTATLPDSLSVCYLVNSASEANELALRLAHAATGQKDVVVLEDAYHGHSSNLIHLSPYKHNGPGGSGAPGWVHTAAVADTFRGRHRDSATAGKSYAYDVARIVQQLHNSDRGVCAFIAESCPSVGGQIIFPTGYLQEVYHHTRKAGGICIADEVQTGYGRLGSHFYGFEQQDVEPDIVVLGKPIGNGHPVAAVVTTSAIAEHFDNGMEFFSTFGGNTVSCAVGLAVLQTVIEERLALNAEVVGEQLLKGLKKLQQTFPIIGDVRGMGLFLGVELVRDKESLAPAAEEAKFVVNRMRDRGILVGTDGPLHNVIKIRPPMTFDSTAASALLGSLQEVLSELP